MKAKPKFVAPKFVAPKSLDKADKMLKAKTKVDAIRSIAPNHPVINAPDDTAKTWKEWEVKQAQKAQRFPVYLTIEEISHIILAVEYADIDKYCDDTILTDINARLGACLANHYLAQGE